MCTASRSGASTGTGASSLDGVMTTQRVFRETSRGALEPCPHASGCVYAGVASSLQVGATRHWNGSDFTTCRRGCPEGFARNVSRRAPSVRTAPSRVVIRPTTNNAPPSR
eukprot:scaffold14948_cov60-Phaeocystis_antarctica.AAC.3